jgi:hypothetical protein
MTFSDLDDIDMNGTSDVMQKDRPLLNQDIQTKEVNSPDLENFQTISKDYLPLAQNINAGKPVPKPKPIGIKLADINPGVLNSQSYADMYSPVILTKFITWEQTKSQNSVQYHSSLINTDLIEETLNSALQVCITEEEELGCSTSTMILDLWPRSSSPTNVADSVDTSTKTITRSMDL